MENDFDKEPEIIYIATEDGEDEPYEVVMNFTLDKYPDYKYLMVVPALESEQELDENEEEAFPFRYEEDADGEIKLFPIEDPEEWNVIEETFNTLYGKFDEEPQ